MTSDGDHQIWLAHNGGRERLRLPVLPEVLNITNGMINSSVNISGLGEVVIKKNKEASVISFSSFFPAHPFPGVHVSPLPSPTLYEDTIKRWLESDIPIHFLVTDTNINLFVELLEFSCYRKGGDVGTIYYSVVLKEHRKVEARKIRILATRPSMPGASGTTVHNGINYALVYDFAFYRARYFDLQRAFGTNDVSMIRHFVNHGMREGRIAHPNFNVHVYRSRYVDLQRAFGANLPLYYRHFINHGHREGRSATGATAGVPPQSQAPPRVSNQVPARTHTVAKNDTLWGIAQRHLGDGSRFSEIAALNSQLIRNPNLIQPGWVLRIPQ